MKSVAYLTILMAVAAGLLTAQTEPGSATGPDSGEGLVFEAEPVFEKMSDHCFVLRIKESGENIAIVATGQGTLLLDPPPEPDLSIVRESLERLAARPVRWLVNTGFYLSQNAGVLYFMEHGAVLLSSSRRQPQGNPAAAAGSGSVASQAQKPVGGNQEGAQAVPPALPAGNDSFFREEALPGLKIIFDRRVFLYPDDLEIQIQALQSGARTGSDIFAYIPAEKVLLAGRLYDPTSYPDIDPSTGGSAIGWVDAMKQVIDSVPLLISAIPTKKPETGAEGEEAVEEKEGKSALEPGVKEEEEKTPEELVLVIPARGLPTDLKAVKEMLALSQGLRNAVGRTVRAGRPCEEALDTPEFDPYRVYGNFYNFAGRLCAEYSERRQKPGAGSRKRE
jgi:hypothetical protein